MEEIGRFLKETQQYWLKMLTFLLKKGKIGETNLLLYGQ